MGRKGVSKRKSPKDKNQQEPTKNTNSAVSNIMRAAEAPLTKSQGNDETGPKKKSGSSKKKR